MNEKNTLKDIYLEKDYNDAWEKVILEALKKGHISCAQVQSVLISYPRSAMLIEKVIEYGYFDKQQRALITVEQFQEIIAKRGPHELKGYYVIDDRPDNHPEVIKRREEMLNSLSKEDKERLDRETRRLMDEDKIFCPLLDSKEISDDECYEMCLVSCRMLKETAIHPSFSLKKDFREICKNCKYHNLY